MILPRHLRLAADDECVVVADDVDEGIGGEARLHIDIADGAQHVDAFWRRDRR